MITTGTTISIDSLGNIVHFAETYGYLTCSQSELLGIGCTDCLYYVSDKVLRCYIEDSISMLVR